MPFSYVPYAGNGSATTFSVPFPYLLKAHVKLRFGFDIVSGTFTSELVEGPGFSWISATQVQCTVAPAAGQTLTIVRETPSATRLVDWQDGSNFIANDLDTADLQNLYVVQEQRDKGDAVAAQQAAATQAANSALTASSAAVTTANSASSTANGLAASIATANANASAAVTTANSASTTANGLAASIATANTNASAAVATANSASTTANGLAASIATANTNASAAVTTANDASTTANGLAASIATANANASAAVATANSALPKAGGTMTGPITLSGDPTQNLHSATKQYVDAAAPSGTVQFYAANTPPTGWLKANGAALSRATYATLFAAIGTAFGAGDGSTTFNLPDLRGEFPRGWDDGRGADSGRAFGTAQAQAFLSHGHGVNDPGHAHGVYDPGHAHGVYDPGHAHLWGTDDATGASGSANPDANGGTQWRGTTSTNVTNIGIYGSGTNIGIYGSGTGISIQGNGGTETRPRNIALLAIIKF